MIWTVARLAALLFTWRVIVQCSPVGRQCRDDRHLSPGIRGVRRRASGLIRRLRLSRADRHLLCNRSSFSTRTTSRWPASSGKPMDRRSRTTSCGASSCRRRWKRPTGRRGLADRVGDGTEQIGWYFSGTFRQNFDYRLYPFDRQDIWLRIWSRSRSRVSSWCPISAPTAT